MPSIFSGAKHFLEIGLLGLTRAFQYAGARSVVASLWQVSDRVTPELMVRFYRHLRSGKPKDQALQAAQIELIREPITVVNEFGREVAKDASAPYFGLPSNSSATGANPPTIGLLRKISEAWGVSASFCAYSLWKRRN